MCSRLGYNKSYQRDRAATSYHDGLLTWTCSYNPGYASPVKIHYFLNEVPDPSIFSLRLLQRVYVYG